MAALSDHLLAVTILVYLFAMLGYAMEAVGVVARAAERQLVPVGAPGVTLINDVSVNDVRHFHVGKGQNVITATDGSNNVTTVVCQ